MTSENNSNKLRFMTNFNVEYKSKIVRKHYDILQLDQKLAPVLPPLGQHGLIKTS